MANTCGDNCVFPVSNLKKDGMQLCSQKCEYYGNYSKDSLNNTIVNEEPYTMAKSTYNGQSEVTFNNITYSNTDDNNTIQIYITKPLHSFGDDGSMGAGELIIAHNKSNSGVNPLWVCIPITSISDGVISSGTNASSMTLVENIIKNIPGPPFITTRPNNNSLLVRQADTSSNLGFTEFNYYGKTARSHIHTSESGGNRKHSHEHIAGIHTENPSETEEDFLKAFTGTSGSTDIQYQNNLPGSYKLNDIIPSNAPYFFYIGAFNSSGNVSYSNCSTIDHTLLNVIVFDIKNGISVSRKYATMLTNTYDPTNKKKTYPLLLDNNFKAIPDTNKNVSYHETPFKKSKEDEIYIDCTPVNYKTTDKTTTILEKDTNNDALDAGASITSVILNFLNSSAFAILLGIIAMMILFRSSKYLLHVVFGKKSLPTPSDIVNKVDEVTAIK